MSNRKIDAIFMANSLQQGFIYHALSQTEDDAYRVQVLFDYKQSLNIENYIKAWEFAVQKYPILRTAFNWEEDIIQIIYSDADLEHKIIDISDLTSTEQEAYITELQEEDRKVAFDLTVPCLMRLFVIKLADEHYTILKSEHHCIADGWSGPILLNTVHQNYKNLQRNRRINVRVQNSYLEAQTYFTKHSEEVKEYWEHQKAIIQETNDLSPMLTHKQDLEQIKALDDTFDTSIKIKGDEYLKIKEFSKTSGITINTLVQFAWHKLIQLYTNDTQTIVGTTISGRSIPILGIEESVGLYINTLPLIIDWENDHTILEQIQYIHEQITALNSNSFANLTNLQIDGKRLFHSLFIFENYPVPQNPGTLGKDQLSPSLRYGVEKLDYPLGVVTYELGDKLVINLKSDHSILTSEKANYLLEKINALLNQSLQQLDQPHTQLSALNASEYQEIIFDWNKTDEDFPTGKTIQQLFEEQVKKTPDELMFLSI